MPTLPTIVFLHIPKTAGQSVHHYLMRTFGGAALCEARTNEQLIKLSVPELRKSRVFSGHMDWSLLDCVERPCFIFTILREPVDRILSFYFYLRREALLLTNEELKLPQNQGKHAILTLSCDDYFTAGAPHMRAFLDDNYDNFYTYYLAGRTFDARRRLLGRKRVDPTITHETILQMARDNLTALSGVYRIDDLERLEDDLTKATGTKTERGALSKLHVNRGDDGNAAARKEKLREIGATNKTFDRIEQMTALDQILWNELIAKNA